MVPRKLDSKEVEEFIETHREDLGGVDRTVVAAALMALPATARPTEVLEQIQSIMDSNAQEMLEQYPSGARGQIRYLLHMAHLQARDWRIISSTVDIPDSSDFERKTAMMVDACRYQGFDPWVLLRKFIQYWRATKDKPKESV